MCIKTKFTPQFFTHWDKSEIHLKFLKIKLQTDLTSLIIS